MLQGADKCMMSATRQCSKPPLPESLCLLLPLIPMVSCLRIAARNLPEVSLESDRLEVADRMELTKESNRGGRPRR